MLLFFQLLAHAQWPVYLLEEVCDILLLLLAIHTILFQQTMMEVGILTFITSMLLNGVQDTAVCVFDPVLVQQFIPSMTTEEPPQFKALNFESLETAPRVSTILSEMVSQASHEREHTLQTHLLKGIINNKIWQYSGFHENAAYSHGYDHVNTIHLAFM